MYIANHYVRVEGRVYGKGEAIPDIPAANAEWLLSVGAIQLSGGIEVDCESEDTEPEDIDVMAGVIMDAPKEESPKKSSTRRKKS